MVTDNCCFRVFSIFQQCFFYLSQTSLLTSESLNSLIIILLTVLSLLRSSIWTPISTVSFLSPTSASLASSNSTTLTSQPSSFSNQSLSPNCQTKHILPIIQSETKLRSLIITEQVKLSLFALRQSITMLSTNFLAMCCGQHFDFSCTATIFFTLLSFSCSNLLLVAICFSSQLHLAKNQESSTSWVICFSCITQTYNQTEIIGSWTIIILLMAKVQHFLPQINPKFICSKGDLHAQEPLNLVCLDPLCRNDPLGCATCFAQIHKYHRVVSLDKFLDDYARNVRQGSSGRAARRIEKHHKEVRELIAKLRESVNQQLNDFEESIDTYAEELRNKTTMRQRLSKEMRVNLQPKQGGSNKEELGSLVRIVLDNSLFDKGNNMVRVAEVLKQDEQKVQALLDRMFNMTQFCQEYVQQVMKSFHFADETIKEQNLSRVKDKAQLKVTKDQFDTQQFVARQKQRLTLSNSAELPKQHWLKQSTTSTAFQPVKDTPKRTKRQEDPKLVFHPQFKHSMIEIREKGTAGVSNVTALKPQYALIAPHLGIKPQQVREWSLQVKSCRNFASQNTLAIGLSPLEQLKQSNFQGYYPKQAVLLTSQGYLLEGGNSRKTELIFSAGDILHCRYDPFYSLFEISKQNGRRLSLTVPTPPNRQLFGCVRLTYASDQIQIL